MKGALVGEKWEGCNAVVSRVSRDGMTLVLFNPPVSIEMAEAIMVELRPSPPLELFKRDLVAPRLLSPHGEAGTGH